MNIIKMKNNNSIYRALSLVVLQIVIVLSAYSQSNILDDLQQADSKTEAKVTVYQDSEITEALLRQPSTTTESNSNCREVGVYRFFRTIPLRQKIWLSR